MPAPPGNLHFSEPAVPVPSCPTLAHPLPPQNIINVGTPAPVAPVMPPPGQLRGPSREPIIGHPPPMVGTIPVLASPIIAPHEYVRSHRLPIVIQPPAQVAQPVLPSPLPSRGTPVSSHEPFMHSPRHSPLPSSQVFQSTYEGPVIEYGSPPIQAYPDPMVVSMPMHRSWDSDYDYYHVRCRPHG